jgi:chitin disaccharide deacetylase
MRYLIVNGDDFGASPGINVGIVEAHRRGILTSASLMVNRPASEEAAWCSRDLPHLSVGLHTDLTGRTDPSDCRAELHRQFRRFQELTGGLPTHLDAHHNAHRDPRLLPAFLDLAREYRLPLREHSPVRYFSKFYGRWDGVTHLEQVRLESLVRMLETEVPEGCTELSCHPGYVDPHFPSDYAAEREAELRTLCEPILREVLTRQKIRLITFREVARLEVGSPTCRRPS